jgi:hypothetical protein
MKPKLTKAEERAYRELARAAKRVRAAQRKAEAQRRRRGVKHEK